MKISLNWLKQYLDTTATLDEVCLKLTAIGLEVEGIENPAATLKGFVVGHVVSAEKHPDADKLKCLVVDTGTEKLKVVCGAPNARAGMYGVFAPAGSYIPGLDVTLKKTNIRGQESNGMMCSERELCLSDEHNGIIDLVGDYKTGSPAAPALGLDDVTIEVNLTPNRGDAASHYGVARDLAAAGLGTLKLPHLAPIKGSFKNPITIEIKSTDVCPLFMGRYIKGVKNGPSPKWLQDQLKSVGQKSISTLVDITNYFTLGLNRPLHVFDADKITGNIHVRLSKAGEKFLALNDKEYTLDNQMTVVCDDSGVLGLGGIIGGTSTSVSDATVNVYLECAYFSPATIAYTGQKLQIDSDARYRFERGIDPAFTAAGIELATKMIIDLCGGDVSDVFTAGVAPMTSKKIAYQPSLLKSLGGSDLPEARQKEILTKLGFQVANDWTVTSPTWRHDVMGAADLVEEILRIDGYDNIPIVHVVRAGHEGLPKLNPLQKRMQQARRRLATRGMFEAITWSFMAEDKADLFGVNKNQNKKALTLVNPISADLAVMRPSTLPNLLDAASRSTDKGYPDVALFEIGGVYETPEHNGQLTVAAGLRFGHTNARHWATKQRVADTMDAKADVMAVVDACGVNAASLQISRDVPSYYHPGRSAALKMGQNVIAYFGEIHPSIMASLKRDEAASAFEVFLDRLPDIKKKATQKTLLKPSAFQPVLRDFAFVVDVAVEADKLVRAILGVDKTLITAVDIFDVYQGKGMEAGKKSIALAVTLQPTDKTLTDAEITDLSARIITAVTTATGGILRA